MWVAIAIAVPPLVGALALALQQVEERLDHVVAEARVHRVPEGVPRTPAGCERPPSGPRGRTGPRGSPPDVTSAGRPVGRSAGHGSVTS
jgi:hypothetical protein